MEDMKDMKKYLPPILEKDFEENMKIPPLNGESMYHAFISHGSEDNEAAKFIVQALEDKGFKCFQADRDFDAGGSIIANMAVGILKSRRTVLLVSASFLRSKYCHFEVAETLHHQCEKQKCIMIPLLLDVKPADVPSSIKAVNYIQFSNEKYFQRLVKALIEDVPLSSTIPAGDVAHGLAWSYYYGYLTIILPEFQERVSHSKLYNELQPSQSTQGNDIPFLKKFVCILSETANCPQMMKDEDPNIDTIGDVVCKHTVAGNVERDYSHKVHKVKHPDTGKEYLFPGEFCTPLRSMFKMEQDGIAGLSMEERVHQTMLFQQKLKEIMEHPKNAAFRDNILFVEYRDVDAATGSGVQKKECLSRKLASAIAHELEKDDIMMRHGPGAREYIAKHGTPV